MWGFFESVWKIGFGVAFGFFVHETIVPLIKNVGNRFADATVGFPEWSLILVYPGALLMFFVAGVAFPLMVLLPFFMIRNKILRGKFWEGPSSWDAVGKEWWYFYAVWIYIIWASIFGFK